MNAKEELLEHVDDLKVKYVRIISTHSYHNKEMIEGEINL